MISTSLNEDFRSTRLDGFRGAESRWDRTARCCRSRLSQLNLSSAQFLATRASGTHQRRLCRWRLVAATRRRFQPPPAMPAERGPQARRPARGGLADPQLPRKLEARILPPPARQRSPRLFRCCPAEEVHIGSGRWPQRRAMRGGVPPQLLRLPLRRLSVQKLPPSATVSARMPVPP